MAGMTWPLTSDGAGAVTYTANEWRTLLTNLFTEGILGAGSFEVTERAAGANMKLDIAAGVTIITGDDAAGQGNYIYRDDAAALEAVTIPTANPTNPRIDRVGLQLRDPSEGGAAGRDTIPSVVTGTAAASPTAPAEPDSFQTLALVTVPAGATSILDANITDARVHAAFAHPSVVAPGSIGTTELEDDSVTDAKMDATDWTDVTYGSGWSAPAGGEQRLRYKRVGKLGFLYGGMSYSGAGGVATMGSLPAGFRPPANFTMPCHTSPAIDGRCELQAGGSIVVFVGTSTEVFLNAVYEIA